MENSKTLDSKYFYWLLENAIFWGDLTEAENQLENDLQNNYECKNIFEMIELCINKL